MTSHSWPCTYLLGALGPAAYLPRLQASPVVWVCDDSAIAGLGINAVHAVAGFRQPRSRGPSTLTPHFAALRLQTGAAPHSALLR